MAFAMFSVAAEPSRCGNAETFLGWKRAQV
jgi:hypothetical protein